MAVQRMRPELRELLESGLRQHQPSVFLDLLSSPRRVSRESVDDIYVAPSDESHPAHKVVTVRYEFKTIYLLAALERLP